jgi:hypothetical protein
VSWVTMNIRLRILSMHGQRLNVAIGCPIVATQIGWYSAAHINLRDTRSITTSRLRGSVMYISVFVSEKGDCTGSDSLQDPLFAEFSVNFVTFLLIYFQQDATLHSLFISGKLLYMFRVVSPPIIRNAHNCIYSICYL